MQEQTNRQQNYWPIPLPEKNFGRKLNIARDARTNKQQNYWLIPPPEKNFGRKLNIARDARTNKQTTKLLAYPILSIPIVLPLSEEIYMKIKPA